jgi:transcription elongation factor GreA
MTKPIYITKEGLEKLEAELEQIRAVRRPEVAEKIQRAKERGGTENNAEYEDAKNEQAFVEGRLLTLENIISRAVPAESGKAAGKVTLGRKVLIRNQDGKIEQYSIVGSAEAKPIDGKISNESPVGRALLGRTVGEEIEVATPAGQLRLLVMEIT